MAALLTYRSRDSFESRFGRRAGVGGASKVPKGGVRIMGGAETTNPLEPGEADLTRSPRLQAWREHNDGHKSSGGVSRRGSETNVNSAKGEEAEGSDGKPSLTGEERTPKVFSAQSYLRYQGDKVNLTPLTELM